MPSIGSAASATRAYTRVPAPARVAIAVLGAAALGTAAWLGVRALRPYDQPATTRNAADGAATTGTSTPRPTTDPVVAPSRRSPVEPPTSTHRVETPTPTDPVEPPPRTQPGGQLQQLVKTGPRAATSASDPQAFHDLLAADGPGWAAADGTLSIPLPDGQNLWLFGDTIVRLPGGADSSDFVRNTAVLQDGATATTLTTGTASDADDFLKPAAPDEWYWPGSGIAQGNELVLFMSRIHKTASGAPGWNFEGVGSDMLVLDLHDLSVKDRIAMPGGTGTDWGSAVVESGNHTYVYGFRGYADEPFRRESLLARTTRGELGHAAFEYWDGTGWSRDPERAAPVANGLSNSYSVFTLPDGRFAMANQEPMFGTKLRIATADRPQGPWSRWTVVDDGPPLTSDRISYNAQVHPQFTADGHLLASWNMNRKDAQLPGRDELDDYRPVFRSIDIERLDG